MPITLIHPFHQVRHNRFHVNSCRRHEPTSTTFKCEADPWLSMRAFMPRLTSRRLFWGSNSFSLLSLMLGFMAALSHAAEVKPATGTELSQASTWDTQSDTWAWINERGDDVPSHAQVGPVRPNRTVGMFYFVWHGDDDQGPWNVSEILRADPKAIDKNGAPWGPLQDALPAGSPRGSYWHWWGEPLFGYYREDIDGYVIRRHAQMLTDAGIDFIAFDTTNYGIWGGNRGAFYDKAYRLIISTYTEIRAKGGKTPHICWMLGQNPGNAKLALTDLWNEYYSKDPESPLWFRWEGKPVVYCNKKWVSDPAQLAFFTFRAWAPNYTSGGTYPANSWSWLSLYPQAVCPAPGNPREYISVGVAQNALAINGSGPIPLNHRDKSGNFIGRGRSFHNGIQPLSQNPLDPAYPSAQGLNFQEQWDRAHEVDPSIVFVTGWNEWTASRWSSFGPQKEPMGCLVDQFTPEFSRDIEPTREKVGGIADHYYRQLITNVRRYKGAQRLPAVSAPKTITVDGDATDWIDVLPEYRDDVGDPADRNSPGSGSAGPYVNKSGLNDLRLGKVARDKETIYFLMETEADLKPCNGKSWMRLYIGTDQKTTRWNGFHFVIRHDTKADNRSVLERHSDDRTWSVVSEQIVRGQRGKVLELAIPRKLLGIADDTPLALTFKWHDQEQVPADEMDAYINGDAAPNGRFAYRYREVQPSVEYIRNQYAALGERLPLKIGEAIGTRFATSVSTSALEVHSPSYGNNIGGLTLRLHKWQGDFASSIAGPVIAQQKFVNFNDNAWLRLKYPAQPAGSYLWVLDDPAEQVGVWLYGKSNVPGVTTYRNGKDIEGGCVWRLTYVGQ